ncbi:MAG: hypothetical protein AAF841_13430, partial [Pseudomonadota bacterium]
MAQPRAKKHMTGRISARGWSRGLLWMLIGPCACLALVVGAALAIWPVTIADDRVFQGVLRPTATPLAVDLPRHAILGQITAHVGDVVREGQTLALLDAPAMEARRSALLREARGLKIERLCQLSESMAQFEARVAEEDVAWAAEDRARPARPSDLTAGGHPSELWREEVLADCALGFDVWRQILSFEEDQLANLHRRSALLKTELALAMEAAEGSDQKTRQAAAQSALTVLLARNGVEREILQSMARIDARQAQYRRGRLKNAQDLREKIQARLGHAERLQALIGTPRIKAPNTGIVTRLRDPGPRHEAISDLRFIELTRAGQKSYALAISVPVGELASLKDGARVQLDLAGAFNAPPIGGALDLERRSPSDANTPTIMVNFDAAARAW